MYNKYISASQTSSLDQSDTRLKWLQGLSEYVKNFHVESQQSTVHVYLYKLNTCNV